MTASAPLKVAKIKVSSVLNDDTKNYGKQFLLDDSEETCWNSAAGDEQFVMVQFEESTSIKRVELMFQGGFSAKRCTLGFVDGATGKPVQASFFPSDCNALQSFDLCFGEDEPAAVSREWTLRLEESPELFGRITLYKLNFYK